MLTTRDPPPLCWRPESLEAFRAAYIATFNEDIEGEELERAARYLLSLYKNVYGSPREIITEEETNQET